MNGACFLTTAAAVVRCNCIVASVEEDVKTYRAQESRGNILTIRKSARCWRNAAGGAPRCLAELAADIIPPGVCNVVTGDGAPAGAQTEWGTRRRPGDSSTSPSVVAGVSQGV